MLVPGAGLSATPLLLLIATPRPAVTAITDHDLPLPERHDARWEWLDLWPRLLHIRRQFDRDGYPRQEEGAVTPDRGPKSGEIKRNSAHPGKNIIFVH